MIPLDKLLTVVYHTCMNVSSIERKRWVIDGVDETAVRYAKALAAEHGLRVSTVVAAAIFYFWDESGDTGNPNIDWDLMRDRE